MQHPIDITNVMLFLLAQPAGGSIVVAVSQFLKKTAHMDSEHAIHAMVVVVSVVAAAVAYYLDFRGLPLAVLGLSAPATYGFSQGLYRLCKLLTVILPRVSMVLGKLSSVLSGKASTPPANINTLDLNVPAELLGQTAAPVATTSAAPSADTTEINF